MATNTKSSSGKAASTSKADVTPKHVGEDTLGDKAESFAKAGINQVKDAMPTADDVASMASDVRDYVADSANVDVRGMADDAAEFVRRNPGASIAAAAGIGILIGVLASKRS